jgi:hypothetical protein
MRTLRSRIRASRAPAAVLAAGACTVAVLAGPGEPAKAAAAPAPATITGQQLENLENTVRADSADYAGLWIDQNTDTVYVAAARSAASASITPSALLAQASGTLTPAQAYGTASMKVDVVPVTYSAAQLQAITGKIGTDTQLQQVAAQAGSTITVWYADPSTDTAVIGFSKVTAAETAEVKAEFGDAARVIAQQPANPDVLRIPAGESLAQALKKEGVNVKPATSSGPEYDSSPWYGGDPIEFQENGHTSACTAGYEFNGGKMSTAGHCAANPDRFWYNGNQNQGQTYGTTYTVQFGNGRTDMQLLSGSYDPAIWAGPNGDTAEVVSGSGGVAMGGGTCDSGSDFGMNCDGHITEIDATLQFCENGSCWNEIDQDVATDPSGDGCLVEPGESGAPVFTSTSRNAPWAIGTITGALGNNCNEAIFNDMYELKAIFGTAPTT